MGPVFKGDFNRMRVRLKGVCSSDSGTEQDRGCGENADSELSTGGSSPRVLITEMSLLGMSYNPHPHGGTHVTWPTLEGGPVNKPH